MHTPSDTIDAARRRAAEITWWNRRLTKLDQIDGITNAESFVADELIETKGPYVEYVDAPKPHERSAKEFLAAHGFDESIIEAVITELFDGVETGTLYQHQAELIDDIRSDTSDNVLAVPTATGKTEAFFLPILDYCLSTTEPGLKSIIVYPMKTLSVDQLNRFLNYLTSINDDQSDEDEITIGIWDGDTPQRVGERDSEIKPGSFVRGLECPRTEEKLSIREDGVVESEKWEYPWLKVTRDRIESGVDVLLSTPEAIDYLFVSDKSDRRQILGRHVGDHPVGHVVFDEAHVWRGIQGSAISLLVDRLKHFYADTDPQVTLVSATIKNPRTLAHQLTGTAQEEINCVEFTAKEYSVTGETAFPELPETTVAELVTALGLVELGEADQSTFTSKYPDLAPTISLLERMGLITERESELVIPSDHDGWLSKPLRTEIQQSFRQSTGYTSIVEFVREETAEFLPAVLHNAGVNSRWYDLVTGTVPEVAEFAQWFDYDTTGSVGFKHYEKLRDELVERDVDDPDAILRTIMALGRLAGVITEKYHYFVKPPLHAYWCSSCQRVSRNDNCPDCDVGLPELQFCDNCHHPYLEAQATDSFEPLGGTTDAQKCPSCGDSIRLTDVGVPTSTLLSFMLTEICRTTPSRKTLVFSDSHAAAESVGDKIFETEYGLMAETLYVKELLDNDGTASVTAVQQSVLNTLREEYWEPLSQNRSDAATYKILTDFLGSIQPHATLDNCRHLVSTGLVLPECVYETQDRERFIIGHALYNRFVTPYSSRRQFTKCSVRFDGLTRTKIVDRLEGDTGFKRETIEAHVDELLRAFLENGIVTEQDWSTVRDWIQNANIATDKEDEAFEFVEQDLDVLDSAPGYPEHNESGVFTREPDADRSTVRLVPTVLYCRNCYTAVPVPNHLSGPLPCPDCGVDAPIVTRFDVDADGTYSGKGYAEFDTEWGDFALDHWAHDICTPLEDENLDFITASIHKGNVPETLRGAIEEAFRSDDPEINIVSSTPTMELGIDIGKLDTVTQVGIPPTLTNYVQRSGRTGRSRGSSSLVTTVIRGDHSVDNHYYADLEAFFREFSPVRVPEAEQFDELLAGHVVTEVMAYLARNFDRTNTFQQSYTIQSDEIEVTALVEAVESNLEAIVRLICGDYESELREYVKGIFGSRGVEVFEQVFLDESSSVYFERRISQTFERLTDVAQADETDRDLVKKNRRLDQWLNRLGFIANYRDFGEQFPVRFAGRDGGIDFAPGGRLYDMFPGPQNEKGAKFSLHGTKYVVTDVVGAPNARTVVGVCTNEECRLPFESYSEDAPDCPHCGERLTEMRIHEIASVEIEKSGRDFGYKTYPVLSTQMDFDASTSKESESTVFGLPCRIRTGECRVTDFVPAFQYRYQNSNEKELERSEARISGSDNKYAPVGHVYTTQGLELSFLRTAVETRLSRGGDGSSQSADGTYPWSQLLTSLEQALSKAIAVTANCELSDFRVRATITADRLLVTITDSRQGGNGVRQQVREALDDVVTETRKVCECTRCEEYCEECLLLERTPAIYLERGLLSKTALRDILM